MAPDDRRDQILRVAAEHFSRDGYDRASMTGIARDAGVTRALVYHYFPGKEAVLEAVLRQEAGVLLADTAPDPSRSVDDNIDRALRAYLDHFAASRGGLRELYTPHPMTPVAVREIAAANHVVQVERLLAAVGHADTPQLRLALGAWLAFVEEAARESVRLAVDRTEIVRLCRAALTAVTTTTTTQKENKK